MEKELWYDARSLEDHEFEILVPLAINHGYQGIMVNVRQKKLYSVIPRSVKKCIDVCENEVALVSEILENAGNENVIVFAEKCGILDDLNVEIGLMIKVEDKDSLERTVMESNRYKVIVIEFESETNIPLELVLAFSQKNQCHICKKVSSGAEGWIASMVMEMGSHSVLLDTRDLEEIIELKEAMEKLGQKTMELKKLTITERKHIGMGDRVCIDTTSLLKEDEGMILGSTSKGGILVSSETHYLPYMELRPFRVNAGGIHLYAWNLGDRTDYLSEIKGGSSMMAVDSKGNVRSVAVGRVKIERRPLILICAKDEEENEVNVVLQDDWHVRVIGIHGEALNCTELKPGDQVLGYTCESGRHVGIKIDENIIEK